MERKFKRDIQSLDKIFSFISEFITKYRIDDSLTFTLNLVVEELFTNLVKYNSETSHDILISLSRDKNQLIISLTDFDVEPFDVTKSTEVDVDQSIKKRKVGGLGLHLVKRMVDYIDYEYKNRESKITLIKNLEH
jgi:anti-sigma regulatory factor (Ser/Thr protein kinase)